MSDLRFPRTMMAAVAVAATAMCVVTASPPVASADALQNIDDATVSTTAGFGYDGGWTGNCCFRDLAAGTVHYTSAAGATATFTFTGTSATVRGVRDVDQGQVSFRVDNGATSTVDNYAATRDAQAALFDTGTLPAGPHTITITALGTKNTASTGTLIALDSADFTGPTIPAPGFTLTSDLTTAAESFTPWAAGSLYGIFGSGVPSSNLVDGMRLRTLATKAQDGQQHPGSDALEVAKPFFDAGGQEMLIYATDVYRNFPYERTSVEQYQGFLRTEVEQVKASPYRDKIVFIPYNEPEGNWFPNLNGSADVQNTFNTEWLSTYRLIKSIDPNARIGGPNLTGYYPSTISSLLTFCKANNCMPDLMTWHELAAVSGVRNHVSAYRDLEKSLGIGPLPINLNEYATPRDLAQPSTMLPWMAALTDVQVDGDLAYWRVNGTLDDSVAQQNTPNAQWWLYNWYGSLTGKRVPVSSSGNNNDGTPQGLSTYDATRRSATMLLSSSGKPATVTARFANMPSSVFGGTAHVSVFQNKWSGNTGAAEAPLRVADKEVPVAADGSLAVDIASDADSAYKVVVTPGGGTPSPIANGFRATYEAEKATLTGSGYNINNEGGDATSGGQDVGGLRTGSTTVIDFAVEVPRTGTYTLRLTSGSNAKATGVNGTTNVFARVDKGAAIAVPVPVSYNWPVWNNSEVTLQLSAGAHSVTLSTTGDNGAAMAGDAIVDKIDIIEGDAATAPVNYEAEQGDLAGDATVDYTARSQSGAAVASLGVGGSTTLWVSSPRDGYADLALKSLGGGTGTLSVNGHDIASSATAPPAGSQGSSPFGSSGFGSSGSGPAGGGSSAAGTQTHRVFLAQGVNRVVIAGTGGRLLVDSLLVTPVAITDTHTITVPAESGKLSGTAALSTEFSNARGSVVTAIGNGRANSLTVTATVPSAGKYALTTRFANAEELPSNHYNPDLMVREGQLSVNGGAPVALGFGPTYSVNQFFTVTTWVDLKQGANTVELWADQRFNLDGTTIGKVVSGDGGVGSQLRSNQAANIDEFTVSPVAY